MFESDKEHIFAEDELVDLCREWQERLRLEHWDVALRVARVKEFKHPCNAESYITLDQALCAILIIDQTDYPETPFKRDMEVDVVHELLHLHFQPFDNFEHDSLEHTMLERAIDHIAKALVKLKREGEMKK